MQTSSILFVMVLFVAVFLSIATNKLTLPAAVTASVLAGCIFAGTGFTGIALLGAFFIAGVMATSFRQQDKQRGGHAENDNGKRKTGQVLANGGIAALLAILAWIDPAYKDMLIVLVACSFSAATADTVSSELGMVLGKRFYNILGFRKDRRGENGVVSLEGTLCGVAGSLFIAVVYTLMERSDTSTCFIIIVAGTIGNLADSLLGATLERQGRIGNNMVNILNTTSAVIAGWMMLQQ